MAAPAPELSSRRKRLVLIACILGSTIVFVDSTVVNVALPAIQRELGGGLAGEQWTSNAYLLTLGSLLLIGGSLGDLFGERRVFISGVAGFGATSLLCAIAPSIGVLIFGRALQGVAGALLVPSALAVIVNTFPEQERGRVVGLWAAWSGIGSVLGPLVGGQLVDGASWRWVFAINLPLVLVAIVLIARAVPAKQGEGHAPLDLLGALFAAFGLGATTFALIEQPVLGWSNPGVFAPLIAGIIVFASFIVHEARTSSPMLPLGLFRRRNFSVGNIETFCLYGGLSLLFFYLIVYLQQVAGYSALKSGFASLPVSIVMLSLSSRFGGLADRIGPRFFMGVGPLVAAAGLFLLFRVGPSVSYFADLLPAVTVFAFGLALTVAPLTATVLASADRDKAGLASGVNNAIARVSGLVSIALVGVLIAASFTSSIDSRLAGQSLSPQAAAAVGEAKTRPLTPVSLQGVPPADAAAVSAAVTGASTQSFHLGIGVGGALVACGGIIGGLSIRNPRRVVKAGKCAGGQLAGAPEEVVTSARPSAAGTRGG
jgi:EmrB/QacA subfamily drug resistance transporter